MGHRPHDPRMMRPVPLRRMWRECLCCAARAARLLGMRALARPALALACWVSFGPALFGCSSEPSQVTNAITPFDYDYVAGQPRGSRPYFSFFVTSQDGLLGLTEGEWFPAPDPTNGFGGDFGGLRGADEICTTLARQSNPGDTKVWRAFLSTSGLVDGDRIDAIDRIGHGPWYDFRGFKLSADLAGLMPGADEGRPSGADPQLADMFTEENGSEVRAGIGIDNHDILTGSDRTGRLFDDGEDGRVASCADWTSTSVRGRPGNPQATGGQVPVGHSWPRSNREGRHWISEHTVNGCEPGGRTNGGTAAPQGDFRVGGAGGYGGFYCFALNAVPPRPADLVAP